MKKKRLLRWFDQVDGKGGFALYRCGQSYHVSYRSTGTFSAALKEKETENQLWYLNGFVSYELAKSACENHFFNQSNPNK